MRRQRKWLAALLAVVLTMGLFVTPAFADESDTYFNGKDKTIATGDRVSYAMIDYGNTITVDGWGTNDKGQIFGSLYDPLCYPINDKSVPLDPVTNKSLAGVSFTKSPKLCGFIDDRDYLFENGAMITRHGEDHIITILGDYYTTQGVKKKEYGINLMSLDFDSVSDFVRADDYYLLVNRNGDLFTWGNPDGGRTGTFMKKIVNKSVGEEYSDDTPCKILSDVVAISAANGMSYAVTKDGKIYEFGFSDTLTMIDGTVDKTLHNQHTKLLFPVESSVVQFEQTIDGELTKEQYNEIQNDNIRTNFIQGKVVNIATNGNTTLVLTEDGKLYGWGDNSHGELGNHNTNMMVHTVYLDGMTKPVYIGKPVLVCEDVKDFCIAKYNTYAVLKDGTLVGFGLNNYGQLGIGSVDTNIHDKTVICKDVREVSANRYHVIIRRTDYSVWGFGENYYGEVSAAEWQKGNQAVLSPVQIMDVSGHVNVTTETGPATSKVSTPSTWAQEIVSQADATGMVPDSLKQNYQANITRAQFAELMVKTIELSGLELSKGQAFSDCTYDCVG